MLSASELVKTTVGIALTFTVKLELFTEQPFAPVPFTYITFEPTANAGLNVEPAWAGPWETLFKNNSYEVLLALDKVIGSPWQIVLSASFENNGTIGIFNTVNVKDAVTGHVFEIPFTEIIFPFAKVVVVKVVVAEAAPFETPFTKNSYVVAPEAVNVTDVWEQIELSASELVKLVVGAVKTSNLTVSLLFEQPLNEVRT